ncbi:hypothetical protein I5907_21520 [Panacibacter sp. DH6]|uniref:Uncharacterized protein n=1 Tax=Panacibacter microcysteis TaxID=2793269 RepID=A0A931H0L1_9BACT|nr:hypothetical protein [Panacibacter microcysteis]MBG9378827.1 hypothetical protein [Panacibacter microcysteis]
MKYIPNEAWDDFTNQYISGDLCDIAQGLVTTLILIVPEARVDTFKNSKLFNDMRQDYYNLVKQYTDIKISRPDGITMSIVTKEDFEGKSKGSWYNFFR